LPGPDPGPDAPGAVTPGIAALAILVLGVLVALSLGPLPQPDMPAPLEQLPHAIAYAAATHVLLVVLDRKGNLRSPTIALVAVSMILMGFALELGQSVIERDVEIADVVANSLGVAAAVAVLSFARRVRRLRPARDRSPNGRRR
jgi:VanZ family protein